MGIASNAVSQDRDSRRRRLAWLLLALCMLFFSSGASASAHVRFANVALVGAEGSHPLVELKVDGQTVVPALDYKSSTGYYDLAAGMPTLSVWLAGTKIVERQLDLLEGRGYFFLVIGNGIPDAPYDVTVLYESRFVLDVTEREMTTIMLATYPGYPRLDAAPGTLPLSILRTCRTGTGFRSSGGFEYYPRSEFPSQTSFLAAISDAADWDAYTDSASTIDCVVEIRTVFTAAPPPPGMNPLSLRYVPTGGTRVTEILVGNGGALAPVEWWIVSQPDRLLDPAPIPLGTAAAGIWIAPDHPGLVVNLDVKYTLSTSTTHPGDPPIRVASYVGILTGLDAFGLPRWNLLLGRTGLTTAPTSFNLSEYLGSSAGTVNAVGVITNTVRLKFFSCTRASLSLDGGLFFNARDGAIRELDDAQSIAFQRVSPVGAPCPN
jgi:hypothetical protein